MTRLEVTVGKTEYSFLYADEHNEVWRALCLFRMVPAVDMTFADVDDPVTPDMLPHKMEVTHTGFGFVIATFRFRCTPDAATQFAKDLNEFAAISVPSAQADISLDEK